MGLIKAIGGKIRDLLKPEYEPEHEEPVEHDTVMLRVGGRLTEVTKDDPEIRK